jgi:hypothetical protein
LKTRPQPELNLTDVSSIPFLIHTMTSIPDDTLFQYGHRVKGKVVLITGNLGLAYLR